MDNPMFVNNNFCPTLWISPPAGVRMWALNNTLPSGSFIGTSPSAGPEPAAIETFDKLPTAESAPSPPPQGAGRARVACRPTEPLLRDPRILVFLPDAP